MEFTVENKNPDLANTFGKELKSAVKIAVDMVKEKLISKRVH